MLAGQHKIGRERDHLFGALIGEGQGSGFLHHHRGGGVAGIVAERGDLVTIGHRDQDGVKTGVERDDAHGRGRSRRRRHGRAQKDQEKVADSWHLSRPLKPRSRTAPERRRSRRRRESHKDRRSHSAD